MRQWNEREIAQLPTSDGIAQRGNDMTRIETFTDAAFAFALTILIISFDAVPTTFEEFFESLRKIPTFIFCVFHLWIFWHAHHRWSRHYGLDDARTILLSFALVSITLVYVFPLRVMSSGLFFWLSGGYLPFELTDFDPAKFGHVWVVYGTGFAALCAVLAALYRHALKQGDSLELSETERFVTATYSYHWLFMGSVGVIQVMMAITLPVQYKPYSGMIYFLLALVMPVLHHWRGRRER